MEVLGENWITPEFGDYDGWMWSVSLWKLVKDGGFIVFSPPKIGSIFVANLAGPVNYFFICSSNQLYTLIPNYEWPLSP